MCLVDRMGIYDGYADYESSLMLKRLTNASQASTGSAQIRRCIGGCIRGVALTHPGLPMVARSGMTQRFLFCLSCMGRRASGQDFEQMGE